MVYGARLPTGPAGTPAANLPQALLPPSATVADSATPHPLLGAAQLPWAVFPGPGASEDPVRSDLFTSIFL